MSGIYIHIPFCKQACHYCDFHFSTSLKHRTPMVEAICKELQLRRTELAGKVETIYLGGGTPSLLTMTELDSIFEAVYKHYDISDQPEITLEANPDDLDQERIKALGASSINRLSLGVQSFFDADLQLMNRAHSAEESRRSISEIKQYFDNYSIDLIYGIPGMPESRWLENLEIALSYEVPHLSCYALTVEPKTALKSFIEKGLVPDVDDEVAHQHHKALVETTTRLGYENYEFSNFGKPGYFSRNNLAYWRGQPYLGIGPSAHSFDGLSRAWNISNNNKYIKNLKDDSLVLEREELSNRDRYNEFVMTRLRTQWGISLSEVEELFGKSYKMYLMEQAQAHIQQQMLVLEGDMLTVSSKGKFLSDGLAADLFLVNLDF